MSRDETPLPFPLFPALSVMREVDTRTLPSHLEDRLLTPEQQQDYRKAFEYLLTYGMRSQETFNSYRNEVERLLLWTWLISEAGHLAALRRQDLDRFVAFCHEPPREWVMVQRLRHFESADGQERPNALWRPFRVKEEQVANRASKIKRNIAQASLLRMFSSLNSFFEFLVDEDHIAGNHIPAVKKRSPYMVRDTQIRQAHRLSEDQWHYLVETLTERANQERHFERALFAIVMMKTCYLRISELSQRDSWSPKMGDFFQNRGFWWLKVYGKGRKLRDVTVPDELLPYLRRFRRSRGLSDIPEPGEVTPLIPKERGVGNIGQRQLTRLIDEAFKLVHDAMIKEGLEEDAKAFSVASTHWLRHTGASIDVSSRPLKHLADDLGHASLHTTDRIYIQSDEMERGQSGKGRKV